MKRNNRNVKKIYEDFKTSKSTMASP